MVGEFQTFDNPETREFTKSRQVLVEKVLTDLRRETDLSSALDVGCGVGDFSKFLWDMGFQVLALDGRQENAREAQRRYPQITFLTMDAEELAAQHVGRFDLVLCFGLLYHLENPFRAIRQFHSITDKVLLIESMCVPGDRAMMELLDESRDENQGINYVAFYPSEPCLIKMLYRAGFSFVFRFTRLPEHEFYTETRMRKRQRTLLAASKIELKTSHLEVAKEPFRLCFGETSPWTTRSSEARRVARAKLFSLRVLAGRLLKSWRGVP
jgi:SAM-dependent methyltransferase